MQPGWRKASSSGVSLTSRKGNVHLAHRAVQCQAHTVHAVVQYTIHTAYRAVYRIAHRLVHAIVHHVANCVHAIVHHVAHCAAHRCTPSCTACAQAPVHVTRGGREAPHPVSVSALRTNSCRRLPCIEVDSRR